MMLEKPIIMEILKCGPAGARWRGKLANQTINHYHHKIFFYYGHLCRRRIVVYMKHTVRIINILSDYELS